MRLRPRRTLGQVGCERQEPRRGWGSGPELGAHYHCPTKVLRSLPGWCIQTQKTLKKRKRPRKEKLKLGVKQIFLQLRYTALQLTCPCLPTLAVGGGFKADLLRVGLKGRSQRLQVPVPLKSSPCPTTILFQDMTSPHSQFPATFFSWLSPDPVRLSLSPAARHLKK